MNIELIRLTILSLQGCTEDTPFGEDFVTYRVLGKIFACIDLTRPDRVVLKSPPSQTTALQARYDGVIPAWHWNKRHWIEVVFGRDVDDAQIRRLVYTAYSTVLHGLPKKAQIAFFKDLLPDGVFFTHSNTCTSTMEKGWSIGHAACVSAGYTIALVHADMQKSGRGQQGNAWYSQNGKNLTFTLAVSPTFLPPTEAFRQSELTAVALCRTLDKLLPDAAERLCIKWPNDIYYGDKKLCGTLFQNDITGGEYRMAAIGIGLNVNQQSFPDYLPNPVSMVQIMEYETGRFALLLRFVDDFMDLYIDLRESTSALSSGTFEAIEAEYHKRLYRRSGTHAWRDEKGAFSASIDQVEPDGTLLLRTDEGEMRRYGFKEVEYVW